MIYLNTNNNFSSCFLEKKEILEINKKIEEMTITLGFPLFEKKIEVISFLGKVVAEYGKCSDSSCKNHKALLNAWKIAETAMDTFSKDLEKKSEITIFFFFLMKELSKGHLIGSSLIQDFLAKKIEFFKDLTFTKQNWEDIANSLTWKTPVFSSHLLKAILGEDKENLKLNSNKDNSFFFSMIAVCFGKKESLSVLLPLLKENEKEKILSFSFLIQDEEIMKFLAKNGCKFDSDNFTKRIFMSEVELRKYLTILSQECQVSKFNLQKANQSDEETMEWVLIALSCNLMPTQKDINDLVKRWQSLSCFYEMYQDTYGIENFEQASEDLRILPDFPDEEILSFCLFQSLQRKGVDFSSFLQDKSLKSFILMIQDGFEDVPSQLEDLIMQMQGPRNSKKEEIIKTIEEPKKEMDKDFFQNVKKIWEEKDYEKMKERFKKLSGFYAQFRQISEESFDELIKIKSIEEEIDLISSIFENTEIKRKIEKGIEIDTSEEILFEYLSHKISRKRLKITDGSYSFS